MNQPSDERILARPCGQDHGRSIPGIPSIRRVPVGRVHVASVAQTKPH
jgi:hypothetical protein